MTTTTLHPLAADYLDRLRHAAGHLSRGSRRELLDDVEAHLLETTSAAMSDAEVLTVLDRLGDPEEIVEAQQPSAPAGSESAGAREWSAIVLLLFGGFIFGVGWLVGLVLLWSSRLWTTRDKWIGTLFIPGGYATALIVALAAAGSGSTSGRVCSGYAPETVNGHVVSAGRIIHCTGGGSSGLSVLTIVIAALLLLAPLASAVYLGRRATAASTA